VLVSRRTNGLAAPAATGTRTPAAASTPSVLRTTWGSTTLPATHVTPTRSISGDRAARSSARASSIPVSQSMMVAKDIGNGG